MDSMAMASEAGSPRALEEALLATTDMVTNMDVRINDQRTSNPDHY